MLWICVLTSWTSQHHGAFGSFGGKFQMGSEICGLGFITCQRLLASKHEIITLFLMVFWVCCAEMALEMLNSALQKSSASMGNRFSTSYQFELAARARAASQPRLPRHCCQYICISSQQYLWIKSPLKKEKSISSF